MSTVKTFPGGMVWAGAGVGVGAMYSMVSGAKLKYTKLMGF